MQICFPSSLPNERFPYSLSGSYACPIRTKQYRMKQITCILCSDSYEELYCEQLREFSNSSANQARVAKLKAYCSQDKASQDLATE